MKELKLIGEYMSLDEISEYLPKLDDSKLDDRISKGMLMLNARDYFENDGDFRQWVRETTGEQEAAETVDRLIKYSQASVVLLCGENITYSDLQELLSRKVDIAANDP